MVAFSLIALALFTGCSRPGGEDGPPPPPDLSSKRPKLTTNPIADLTVYSVVFSGSITDTGASRVTDQGFVVGLKPGPTVDTNLKKFSVPAGADGALRVTITNLISNSTFYVRSFATNAQGTGYGNEVQFTSTPEKVAPLDGSVLRSQKEVNDFGAHGYTTCVNNLEIRGSDITDLSPLKSLVILGGGLVIEGTSLTFLEGLDNLEVIGNVFFNPTEIKYNPRLLNLTGLNKVRVIYGDLQIVRNDALASLQGLNSVTKMVVSDMGIFECPRLQSFRGLEKLTYLDGDINIHRNNALTDVSALTSLESMTGIIRFVSNAGLVNLEGFDKLRELGTLQLEHNPSLTSVRGFRSLSRLDNLYADNNPLLADLSALQQLTTMGSITIQRSDAFTDLKALPTLQSLTGGITIKMNPNLASLAGLEKLQSAPHIEISYNPALQDLLGLNGLKTVTGDNYALSIAMNGGLKSLKGLESLQQVTGQLGIGGNRLLTDFCALKPFLLQNPNKQNVSITGNGLDTSPAQIIASCP